MKPALEIIQQHAEEGASLTPSFLSNLPENKEKNAICFASDRNYLAFTLVAIQSILSNASPDGYYDIVILGTDCSGQDGMFQPFLSDRVNIRILDMEKYIEKFGMRDFYVSGNIPMAAYFRFFIPEIFAEYDKVLYLDGDILACDDVNKLLSEELGDALVGCMLDIGMIGVKPGRRDYVEKILGISPEQYFCSGVLLYNIKECKAFDFIGKCLAKLHELVNPPYHDQDVLNAVTAGRTKMLPVRWQFFSGFLSPKVRKKLKNLPELQEECRKAEQNLGIIHYARTKPWNDAHTDLAERWWAVADSTTVGLSLRLRYSERRGARLDEAVKLMGRPWLYLTYSLYKILALFFGGEQRQECQRKSKLLKYLIRHDS